LGKTKFPIILPPNLKLLDSAEKSKNSQ